MEESIRTKRRVLPSPAAGSLPRPPNFLGRVYDAMTEAMSAFGTTLKVRDNETQHHCERVAGMAFALAQRCGLTEPACHEIYLAGLVHDIGKVGIPDSVLHKPGPLTDDEMERIKRHPEMGYQIVQQIQHLQFTLPGILYHHEQWNGLGYPHGLRGAQIPLMARVLAVADAFDAMTMERPYRPPMAVSEAAGRLANGRDIQWDTTIVDKFLGLLESGPTAAIEEQAMPIPIVTSEHLFRAAAALSY